MRYLKICRTDNERDVELIPESKIHSIILGMDRETITVKLKNASKTILVSKHHLRFIEIPTNETMVFDHYADVHFQYIPA